MKVVLREDVVSLGVEGEKLDVADGYARNYLIPKKLAEKATPGVLKDLELRKNAIAKKEEKRIAEAKKEAKKFDGKKIKLVVEANEEGHLYGSVNVSDLAKAVEEQLKEESVDKSKVVITENIKDVGKYSFTIRIHPEVEARLDLEVTGKEAAGGQNSEQK